MEVLSIFALLFFCHVVASDIPNTEPLDFLTEAWPYNLKYMADRETNMISCQTNQMYARVYLYKRYNLRDAWRNALSTDRGRHITIVGQAFYMKKLAIKDSGYYKCLAVKWDGETKTLEKGQLIVSPVKKTAIRLPEIFPNNAVIRLDLKTDRNITCKTIGARGSHSYLTWYRRGEGGELKKVSRSKVHRESGLSNGNHIDIEKLKFKSFSEKDAGVYVCERRMYRAEPTQREIKVETNILFEFKTPRWHIGEEVSIKIALINDFVFISCQTNSAHAQVLLMRKRAQTAPWQVVKTSYRGRVKKIGQTFLIKRLSYTDSAYYKCRATHQGTTITMEKGMLIASIVAFSNDEKHHEEHTLGNENGKERRSNEGHHNVISFTSRANSNMRSEEETNFIPNNPVLPAKKSEEAYNS